MNEFHKKAAITSLKKMFEGRHFSICTIDTLCKLTGCIPDAKDYQALSALHCVNWSDMDSELREMVMLKVAQIFEKPGFDMQILGGLLQRDSTLLN